MNVFLAILWKDLITEWRGRDRAVAMLIFSLLVVVVFHFALPGGATERTREFATLRVLGYRDREVAFILVGELALLIAFALPLGCIGGDLLADQRLHTLPRAEGLLQAVALL